jgi:hypothetical protein
LAIVTAKLQPAASNLQAVYREASMSVNDCLNSILSASKARAIEFISTHYHRGFKRDALLDFRKLSMYREVEEVTRLGLSGNALQNVEQEARHVLQQVASRLAELAENLL